MVLITMVLFPFSDAIVFLLYLEITEIKEWTVQFNLYLDWCKSFAPSWKNRKGIMCHCQM